MPVFNRAAYNNQSSTGFDFAGSSGSPKSSLMSISMLRQVVLRGVSLTALSKGFSEYSPICSMVKNTQEMSMANGMGSQGP